MTNTEKLGRFDHHPDPAIDFEIEVQSIEARLFDAMGGISKPGTDPEKVESVLASIDRAMEFRVGGDPSCVSAKNLLRQLEVRAKAHIAAEQTKQQPVSTPDFDDCCPNCGGEGYVANCFEEYACVDPEGGCDQCMRRCDCCRASKRCAPAKIKALEPDMTTYPAIEIRARKIHATRKENYARNYPWAGDLTFDGGERDFCMETARLELIEEGRAASVERDRSAQLAAMTNEQLDANIASCDFEAQGRYPREVLDAVRAERRLYVAEQFRRSVAAGAAPLDTVTGMLADFVSRSTALDSVREGPVHQIAAE